MPGMKVLPDTLKRSLAKAQRTWAKAHDSAVQEYGDGERAHRVAFAALKHSFEKIGDHWEPKARQGPSDPRSKQSTADKRRGIGARYGGVDAEGHSRDELYERARKLKIPGRSRMNKGELAKPIAKKQD